VALDTRSRAVRAIAIFFLVAGVVAIAHAFVSGRSLAGSLGAGIVPVVVGCVVLAISWRRAKMSER
jgi:hypothetical protein